VIWEPFMVIDVSVVLILENAVVGEWPQVLMWLVVLPPEPVWDVVEILEEFGSI
jgi:hypothetical protein